MNWLTQKHAVLLHKKVPTDVTYNFTSHTFRRDKIQAQFWENKNWQKYFATDNARHHSKLVQFLSNLSSHPENQIRPIMLSREIIERLKKRDRITTLSRLMKRLSQTSRLSKRLLKVKEP